MYNYNRYTKKTIGYISFMTHIRDYHAHVSFKDTHFPDPTFSQFFRTESQKDPPDRTSGFTSHTP